MRIFVSSPSDVVAERRIALQVISRLQADFKHHFDIRPVLWEHEPLLATAHFQEGLIPPSECEVMICLLWSTLGSPLPEQFRRSDGEPGVTGTEWEFQIARASYFESGKPEILVYRKRQDIQISLSDSRSVKRAQKQLADVDQFFERNFHNPDPDKTFKAAYWSFLQSADFEELLYTHLTELLRRRIHTAKARSDQAVKWIKGSPYRGLQSFDLEHADVFFGRSRARNELLNQMQLQIADASPFMMVLGASGTGKSSLVKAGLLPLLIAPGVIPQVAEVRWCVFKPSDGPDNLSQALLKALLTASALPELLPADESFDHLLHRVDASPHALEALIYSTLAQIKQKVGYKPELSVRVLILIDQFEELFALPAISERARQEFVSLLVALISSDHTWVIGTMRSDFFAHCEALPELVALMRGNGQYHLFPPGAGEVEQMIRLPARAAGLDFEHNAEGIGLDTVLQSAAIREPGVLPLLSFTLDQLYQRRSAEGLLTWEAYRQLGEIEGAITRRANETLNSLPEASRSELPTLLATLIALSGANADTVSARAATWTFLSENRYRQALTQAFVDARLLVVSTETNGTGKIVRLAHEALLNRWDKARDWIGKNQDFLRSRARIVDSAHYWQAEGRPADLLIPDGKLLEVSESLRSQYASDLDGAVHRYIDASLQQRDLRRREAEARHRETTRKNRRNRAAVLAVTLIVLGFGGFAWHSQLQAQRYAEAQALGQARAAERAAAALLDAAEQERGDGNALGAISLAITAVRGQEASTREILTRAATTMHQALEMHPEHRSLGSATLTKGGFLVEAQADGMIEISAAFGASESRRASAFEATEAGSALLLQDEAGKISLWQDWPTGARTVIDVPGSLLSMGFTNGDTLAYVVTTEEAALLDTLTGEQRRLSAHSNYKASQIAGGIVLLTEADGTLVAWNGSAASPLLRRPVAAADGRIGASSAATEGLFALDLPDHSSRLLTRDESGLLELWSLDNGERLAQIRASHFRPGPGGMYFTDAMGSLHWLRWADGWVTHSWPADAMIMAFANASDRTIATLDQSGRLRVWDSTGEPIAGTTLPTGKSASMVMAAEGKRGFVRIDENDFRFSIDDQQRLTLGQARLMNTVLDIGQKYIIQAEGESWRFENLQTGSEPIKVKLGADARLLAIDRAWSRVAVQSAANQIEIWEIRSGDKLAVIPVDGRVSGFEFYADGRVAQAESSSGATVWHLQKTPQVIETATLERIASLDRWGDQVVVGIGDAIELRPIFPGGQPSRVPVGSTVESVRFLRDGSSFLVGTQAGLVLWFDRSNPDPRANLKVAGPVAHIETLPTGKAIIATKGSSQVAVWTPGSTNVDFMLDHWGTVLQARSDETGRYVATLTVDGSVHLWDAEQGQHLDKRAYRADEVQAFGFDDETLHVLLKSETGRLALNDPETGTTLLRVELPPDKVLGALVSPDSSRVSILTVDGVEYWNAIERHRIIIDQQPDTRPEQDRSHPTAVAKDRPQQDLAEDLTVPPQHLFSPDGQRLIVKSGAGNLFFYDSDGERIKTPFWNTRISELLGFDIDSQMLITEDAASELRYWRLDDGQEVHPPDRPRAFYAQSGTLTIDSRPTFRTELPFSPQVSSHPDIDADQILSLGPNFEVLTWSGGGTLELTSLAIGETIRLAERQASRPSVAVFSTDSQFLLLEDAGQIRFVRLHAGSVIDAGRRTMAQR